MRKIDRLRLVEATFGSSFVLQYFYCLTWAEIESAIEKFESQQRTWALRTDLVGAPSNAMSGFKLPFIFHGNREEAFRVWEKHRDSLGYIVLKNLPTVSAHGVALLIDEEHLFVEVNDKEPFIAQRSMYENPKNLKQFGVGLSSRILFNQNWYRCYNPESAPYGLDRLYPLIVSEGVWETTFTLTLGGQVVVW